MPIPVLAAENVERAPVRRRWRIGGAILVAVAVAALTVLFRPSGRRGPENGSFANDCCGTLQLHDGEMILNGKPSARYEVGRDARGPYILPRAYVGNMDDIGFEIDGSRPASKLRLDRLPMPQSVIIPGSRTSYKFTRQSGPNQNSGGS